MKTKGTIIFALLVVVVLVVAVVLVPKIFPKENVESEISTSAQTSVTPSTTEIKYTLTEMISQSDNVVSGTVIKADVDENGVLYTMTVSWRDVLKGRNYATMGYAYVNGVQTLELNKKYLFIGDTAEEKYHYKEPFEKAPWVFFVNDDETLSHISNGEEKIITDLNEISMEKVKSICKNLTSSK